MTVTPLRRPTSRDRRSSTSPPAAVRHAAPSGDLINAILQYADVQLDMSGGRTLLRLSAWRSADPVIAGPLGREAPRLADVGVIWDDEEGEIFRVLDAAAGDRLAAVPALAAAADEPQFELTPAALAYLEASQGRA